MGSSENEFGLGILIKSSPPYTPPYDLQIFVRDFLKDFLRNFFGFFEWFSYKGAGVVATPDGVLPRDSH